MRMGNRRADGTYREESQQEMRVLGQRFQDQPEASSLNGPTSEPLDRQHGDCNCVRRQIECE
jgi:hypothetical protein